MSDFDCKKEALRRYLEKFGRKPPKNVISAIDNGISINLRAFLPLMENPTFYAKGEFINLDEIKSGDC